MQGFFLTKVETVETVQEFLFALPKTEQCMAVAQHQLSMSGILFDKDSVTMIWNIYTLCGLSLLHARA